MQKSVGIVMTYFNRKKLLYNTLKSIDEGDHPDKILIVDDCSTDGDDITCFETDTIKVLRLENKTWLNTCMAFNYGFKEMDTDVIILQNAECLHVGNVVGYTRENARNNLYLNFSAYSINEALTNRIIAGDDVNDVIYPLQQQEAKWGENGWYNHIKYRPKMFHFCSAITKNDLYSLGGFDERFADGLGFDDDDLVNRIILKNMRIRIVSRPIVVHQHHVAYFQEGTIKMKEKMSINNLRTKQNKSQKIFDVKQFNKIYK
jgi:GT2 family glycosyltransferase